MKIPAACDDLTPRTPEALADPILIEAWDEFRACYPDKEDCLDEIVRVLLDSGLLQCQKCEKPKWKRSGGRRLKCLGCKKKRSATAGTFFDHMRAHRAWLAAIWFAERGIILSGCTFQKLLNIAYSSARLILKRVMIAMQTPMQDDQDSLTVSTKAFIELFRRRSSETEAKQAPRTEENAYSGDGEAKTNSPSPETERAQALEKISKSIEGHELAEEQLILLKTLAEESLNSDRLASKTGLPIRQINACLSMMEMDGLCQRLPGNQFSIASHLLSGNRSEPEPSEINGQTLAAVKESNQFILKRFKGISRKDLQIYLVAHWCSVKMRQQSDRSVLKACLSLGKKTSKDMFLLVTSPVVHVCAV